MCGIAGIVAPDGVSWETLAEMTHRIAYRGPSGFGFAYAGRDSREEVEIIHGEDRPPSLKDPVIGLGNHRLAILDISSAGNMPMCSEDGRYCLTYNGEIYNYKEVRQELAQLGYPFRTQTDTEVILRAYQEWGEACLQRLNGMWSFGLWDQRAQRLFCARDRFGVKPFYYTIQQGCFFFGSEIKQLLFASGMRRSANPRVVCDFLEWGLYDHSAETFFEGVFQLQGSHWLRLDLREPLTPVIGRYWELKIDPVFEMPEDQAIEEFRRRFRTAVEIRLRSDVPVGIALSGGLDSSSVVCEANQIAPDIRFQTFSACFTNPALDEREYVATATGAVGGIGHPVYPQAEPFWSSFESMTYHQDEPVGSPSAFAQWSVMKEANRCGIPVMLSGQGGDEALCGYQKYRYFYLWQLLRTADTRFFREAILSLLNGTNSHWTVDSVVRYLPGPLRGPLSLIGRVCMDQFQREFQDHRPLLGAPNGIVERQKIDLVYSSIPCLLHSEDRNSMAHSIESRLPFLDYRLIEFTVNCPPCLKLRDGWSKWILRSALVGTLPEKIRLRKTKLGFNAPDRDWLLVGLHNGVGSLWNGSGLRAERFLSPERLSRECRYFLNSDAFSLPSAGIFRAIALERWARTFSVD